MGLAACSDQSLSKPDDQKKLDEQFYGLWLDVSSKEGEAALAAQRELDVLTQTMHAKYVDHLVANWICKPWILEGKEIVLTKVEKGASFECINTDGLRECVLYRSPRGHAPRSTRGKSGNLYPALARNHLPVQRDVGNSALFRRRKGSAGRPVTRSDTTTETV